MLILITLRYIFGYSPIGIKEENVYIFFKRGRTCIAFSALANIKKYEESEKNNFMIYLIRFKAVS